VTSESKTENLNNLKHIYAALTAYIVDRCRRKLPLPSGEPDLEAVACATSDKDAIQFLKLILLSAIFGRYSMEYIQQLTSLSAESQAQFYLILEEPEAVEEEEKVSSPRSETHVDQDDGQYTKISEDLQGKDRALVYEERIAELIAANKGLEQETSELKEQIEDMHDLQTKLQKRYDNQETQYKDTAARLEALRSGKGEQSMLGIQRTKMQQQEDVIATLENQINVLKVENDDLKVQTDFLRSQSQGFQQMQDEVFELKLEREELQRKTNATDKYKQKLQSLQDVEEENETLKHRVAEMQRELKQSDSEQLASSDLRRENDELQRLVSNIEQELSDSVEAKKRAEVEKLRLEANLKQADDQSTRWQTRAAQLQRMLNQDPTFESPLTPRAGPIGGLGLAISDDGSQQDSDLSKDVSAMQLDDPNMITDEELQAIISVMKAHTQHTPVAERTSSIQEQQKLAAKIEKTRATTKELIQVIDYLAQSRVEFVGVKALDEESPYKPVTPHVNDLAATYGVASQSARSSVNSLSAASRRSSIASFQSTHSNANPQRTPTTEPRRSSLLRVMFGSGPKH
jgi:hypothetical protein